MEEDFSLIENGKTTATMKMTAADAQRRNLNLKNIKSAAKWEAASPKSTLVADAATLPPKQQ